MLLRRVYLANMARAVHNQRQWCLLIRNHSSISPRLWFRRTDCRLRLHLVDLLCNRLQLLVQIIYIIKQTPYPLFNTLLVFLSYLSLNYNVVLVVLL